ncbi:hypothetical protein A2U01_0071960 [Trifolium medium]|uniref:Uncharacterized protein n=1 Tax=Trifolium medium TaxID=97028 RepID=A0A392SS81_9FABA|nr:hypothetical protein [Trifolium medium]
MGYVQDGGHSPFFDRLQTGDIWSLMLLWSLDLGCGDPRPPPPPQLPPLTPLFLPFPLWSPSSFLLSVIVAVASIGVYDVCSWWILLVSTT